MINRKLIEPNYLNKILFPKDIEYLFGNISEFDNVELCFEENQIVSKSSNRRKREFSAGRAIAKTLLKKYGIKNYPVLSGTNREPVWPKGVIGSISHCDDFCFVAIAQEKNYKSIGIDIEKLTPIEPDIEEYVCTEAERKWIQEQNYEKKLMLSKLIFCAKESAFKCCFPIVQKYIDFLSVVVSCDLKYHLFTVNMIDVRSNKFEALVISEIKGLFYYFENYIVTISIIRKA